MPILFIKRRTLPLALATAFMLSAPVSVLLPGCGGGSSLNTQTFTSTFPLSSGQSGLFTLNVNGGTASGTLNVSDVLNTRQTRDLIFAIPTGNYVLTGTFTPPSFTLTGNIPDGGPFTITGQVPTGGGNGTYTLTVNGETATGSFIATPVPTTTATTTVTNTAAPTNTPQGTATATARPTTTPTTTASGTPRPTATATNTPRPTATATNTPRPTATTRPTATATARPTATPTTRPTTTPTSAGCPNETARLTFSNISENYIGSRVNSNCGSGFAGTAPGNPNGVNPVISLSEGLNPTIRERRLSILIDSSTPITTGTTYQLSATSPQKLVSYLEFRGTSNTALVWNYTRTGSITVQSISPSSITLVLSGVGFTSQSGGAAGSFTLNGTFTVPRN